MRILATVTGAAMLACATVAAAQSQDPNVPRTPLPYDRGYDLDQPRTRAINEAERPMVEDANRQVLDETRAQTASGGVDMAQYDADEADYRAALADRDRVMSADQAAYARERRAYDDAMADWRMQVADCENGVRAACDAPTPDPADY